ncbi:MAG: hypothetical protein ACERKK_02620 [Poseidonibacter sp.]|uniref:hypothetical protein n=1 Tax=Poseidonibacter sp. TaxID=2321188 RepID=UPI00359E2D9D
MNINYDLANFPKEGYVVQHLNNSDFLKRFRDIILSKLREITKNDEITLETFHKFIIDENEKIDIQFALSKMIWEEKLHFKIIEENIDFYHNLFGKDLDIQTKAHLRIARPNCREDNIGFHRDSLYGNGAFEISNFFPLVNLDEKSALQIEPYSHSRGTIPYTKIENKDVPMGSIKHQLGYPYAPKIIKKEFKIDSYAVPINFGQVLILGLGTIHGQDVNTSDITRWSIDIRVKNSFANSNVKDGYYTNLSSSIISDYAKIYYEACND